MKRLSSLLLALWITSICFAKSALPNYEYDIVGVAIAKEGYYLVEVSALVDKRRKQRLMLRRSALSSVACLKDLLWNDFPKANHFFSVSS